MSLEDKLVKMKVDLKSAEKDQGCLDGVATEARARADALEADKVKLSTYVASLIDDKEALSAEVTKLKASVGKVKAKIFECASYYTWKSRAKLMVDFLEGRHTSWTS